MQPPDRSASRPTSRPASRPANRRLQRHLGIAIVVKLVLLAALWWGFVRGQRVQAGVEQTAAHLGLSAAPHTPAPPRPRTGAHP